MRRILGFVLLLAVMFFSACATDSNEETITLPDLSGLDKTEVEEILDNLDVNYSIVYATTGTAEQSGLFFEYVDLEVGQKVAEDSDIVVKLYPIIIKEVNLPVLTGLNKDQVKEVLDGLELSYTFNSVITDDEDMIGLFSSYSGYLENDTFSLNESLVVNMYGVFVVDCLENPSHEECTIIVTLPFLNGKKEAEVKTKLDTLGISYEIIYIATGIEGVDGYFSSYEMYNANDEFNTSNILNVQIFEYDPALAPVDCDVYPDHEDCVIEEGYFEPIDMVYDGPYLDESFADINYLDPRGGYFDVTLKYCGDGDTAVFNYPSDVYNAITSNAKSVRFLNMDTEETYSGGEEEWGKPASIYTCSLLTSAEAIRIQTDPGDALLGNYGRLLGWIWVKMPGETEYFLLNYMVVKQGLAQVKYEFGAGTTISYGAYTYNEWMHVAEDYAIAEDLGQWGDLLDYYWNYEENEPYYDRWN